MTLVFALLASPSPALASTAVMNDGALTYTAAPGEANHVFVVQSPGVYRIVDVGTTITAGAGCSTVSAQEVVCSIPDAPDLARVTILAGDLDDFVSVSAFPVAFEQTRVLGEDGDDVLEVNSASVKNTLNGGVGDDTLLGGVGERDVLAGGAGADSLSGGEGSLDTVSYSARTNPVTADDDGVADDGEEGEGDNIIGVEALIGGSGADALSLRNTDDQSLATVSGRAGNDTLLVDNGLASGGDGADIVTGTGLTTALLGGAGNDRLNAKASGLPIAFGGLGNDLLVGGFGDDDLVGGPGSDSLSGGPGSDRLQGDRGGDALVGGPGSDLLTGGRGRDTLRARDGRRDWVFGGADRDRARIDAGRDRLSGVESLF